MKKLSAAILAILAASCVLALAGCELSFPVISKESGKSSVDRDDRRGAEADDSEDGRGDAEEESFGVAASPSAPTVAPSSPYSGGGGGSNEGSLTNSGSGGTWTRDAQLLYDWMDDGHELLDITINWENGETTSFGGHNGKWRIISRAGDRRDTGFNYSLNGSTFYLDPTTADVHYVLSGGGSGNFTHASGEVEYFTWEAWVPSSNALQFLDEALASYGFDVSDSYNGNYAGDYVIPHSDERLLTDSDLSGLTDWELVLARNEIYARHGRKFQMAEFQDYFGAKSWYYGIYEPAEFDANVSTLLSDIERKNIEFIQRYEDAH